MSSWSLRHLLLAFALLGLCLGPLQADEEHVELIQLKGRTAEELIPLLLPMVKPNGALTGSGYQLIVKATPEQQAQVRQLLEQLDHPPQRLLITVHMGELSKIHDNEQTLLIDAQTGHTSVGIGAPPVSDSGLYIGQRDEAGDLSYNSYRRYDSRTLRNKDNELQLSATEGYPAYIDTGMDYPYPSHLAQWQSADGTQGDLIGYRYKPVRTGFYARVNLRGKQAVIDISPQQQALSSQYTGAIDSQRISTTVTGPTGQWIRIGGTGEHTQEKRDTTGYTAHTHSRKDQPVWIRVDVLE